MNTEYNKYTRNDIEIGDEIYFDSTSSQSNYDSFWKVHGFSHNAALVNLNKEHYWSVEFKYIRQHSSKIKNDESE